MAPAPKRIYTGLKMYHWTVVSRMPNDNKTRSPNLRKRLKVKCVCGSVEVLPLYYLTRKGPKESCGCMNRGLPMRHKMEYSVWYMMNVRCNNPKHRSYKDYGGRGIQVCPRWQKSNPHGFANFLEDMGPRRYFTLTLDRIAVNGNYEPGNCRWATWDEQNQNKREHLLPPPEADPEAKAALDELEREEEQQQQFSNEELDDSDERAQQSV
jgi:hypothetical protein